MTFRKYLELMISRAALNPGELEFAVWILQANAPDFTDERTFNLFVLGRAPSVAMVPVSLNLFRKWLVSR